MVRTLGKRAIWKDKEYEFLHKSDGTFAIFSYDLNDLRNGFEKLEASSNRLMKIVSLEELSFVFEKDTIVIYNGDEFTGSVIEHDKIMLYTRYVPLGKKYNMNMRDKDEYYLYVNLKDVDEIIQKWTPLTQYIKL